MSTSGQYLTVYMGGTSVEIEDNYAWTVRETAKELERSTGAGLGFGNVDAGLLRATVTIRGYLDLATVVGGGFNRLRPGYEAAQLELYYHRDDEVPAYTFPVVATLESELGGEVDGQFQWTATVKNKGPFFHAEPVPPDV